MTLKTITFIGLVTTSLSQAASLVWNDAAFSDAAQVDNTPAHLLFARNLGTGTAVTVNGVDFTGQLAATVSAIPNFRWGGTDVASGGNASGLYGAANGVTGMSAGDETTLLTNIVYGGSGNSFQFQNLEIGETYIAQFILVDNRAAQAGRRMHVSPNAGTWGPTYDYTSNVVAPGPADWARIVTTTFVADTTTQGFRYGIQGTGSPEASAIQLRVIPEPSSAAMVAMGAMAMLFRRRK